MGDFKHQREDSQIGSGVPSGAERADDLGVLRGIGSGGRKQARGLFPRENTVNRFLDELQDAATLLLASYHYRADPLKPVLTWFAPSALCDPAVNGHRIQAYGSESPERNEGPPVFP